METYKVSTILYPPFVMRDDNGGYEGFIVDLLDRLAEGANFKYNMSLVKDGMYGGLSSSGEWTGMVGEVARREADIAAGALVITSMRERVVDFTKPFLSNNVRLLVKKPSPSAPHLMALLEPFSSEVWLCILFAAILVSVLFMLIGRFNPYEWRQVPSDKDPRGARHSFGLRDSLMFVFSTLMLQGYRETPRSLAGRTLAVSWFAFAILMLAVYIGVVAPFLTVSRSMVLPFESIDDLARQTTVRVGAIEGGSTFRNLELSSVQTYRELAQNMKMSNSMVKTIQDGVDRVRKSNGRYVMLTDSLHGQYVADNDPSCSLMMVGPAMMSSGLGLAVAKGSRLRDTLTMMILKLREDGTLSMLQNKWWNTGRCSETDMNTIPKNEPSRCMGTAVTLRSVAGAFIILVMGAILSVVFLVGEFVFKKCRQ